MNSFSVLQIGISDNEKDVELGGQIYIGFTRI